MKKTIFIISLFFSIFSVAQEIDLYQITPSWSIGDTRMIHSESESITYIEDTVYSSVKIVGDYSITVIDTVDFYFIQYSQLSDDMSIELNMVNDSVTTFVMEMIRNIESQLSKVDYIVMVDKETGIAIEIQNIKELNDLITKASKELITQLGKKKGKSTTEIQQYQDYLMTFIDSIIPKISQTVLNSVNYLMQAYTYSFPINSTYKQDVTAHDINALGVFGTTEFPAVMTIYSEENEYDLIIYTSTDYDKDFLLKQMKLKSKNLEELTIEELEISENEQVTIDLNTTWIKEHISTVVFQIPKVRVTEKTIVYFNQ